MNPAPDTHTFLLLLGHVADKIYFLSQGTGQFFFTVFLGKQNLVFQFSRIVRNCIPLSKTASFEILKWATITAITHFILQS